MGQKLDTMGDQQSKDELLYQAASAGNVDAIKALCREGAAIEWIDRDGKTPLIVACMNPELIHVVKTLIEMGANVNAYRPGWVVIIPCGSGNPMKPPRFELAIYSTLQDAQPHIVIALWKAKIEEPKFHQSDPSLAIVDQTKTRYKLASGNEGDKQQLQWLYGACKGIPQVIPSATDLDTQNSSAATARQTAAEPAELDNNQSSGAIRANGWENSAHIERYNGWVPAVGQAHSASSNTGWMDGPARKDYNGWGASDSRPAGKQSHHVQTLGDHSRWMDGPTNKDYNDWGVADSRPSGEQSHHVQNLADPSPLVQTSAVYVTDSSAPSAPPIPKDVLDEGLIHYPSIDPNPADLPVSVTTGYGASANDVKEQGGSSSCIICWEAPIEGACIPCGHMAGCMSCLNEVKAKNGLCPVCRGKIDQVIRLYAV
ncbi:XB3 in, putative isoform 2 [Theobroma cacao]|uniref:XB3 in, putative isoform 2 n=1 Tax=Theobroma cacao TaxID=3641 RepID=A0A061DWP5_THECC|nr:XB3 in, putative isoform 2 [Theobroma cacao]